MAENVNLPEGFVLDSNQESSLPDGFALDSAPVMTQNGPQEVKPQPTQQTPINQQEVVSDDSGLFDKTLGAAEATASLASGAAASIPAGLGSLYEMAVSGGDIEQAYNTLNKIQQSLTYQPRTEKGQEYLGDVVEAITPVVETYESGKGEISNAVTEATGSWVLGGLAATIPDAVLQLIGVKGSKAALTPKSALSRSPKAALSQSSPSIKALRDTASAIYKEIDNAGVRVPKTDYLDLGVKLNNIARKSGYDPNLTPKVKGFLERLQSDYKKGEIKLSDIDQLRKVAQIPANTIDNATEAAIGSKMIGAIDDFLDQQGVKISSKGGVDLGKKYRSARRLTSRIKKSEMIDEAVFRAQEAASGFENGLRNEFRSILKNKKKRRGFTKAELDAMRKITQGGTMENLFKKLGKLGFGADQQTNMLLGPLSFAGGFAAGGPVGAAVMPTVGFVSAKISKQLGKKNVKFLDDIVKAGYKGENIVEAYIKNVPKKMQNPETLSSLLADPSVDASTITSLASKYKSSAKLIRDADFLTKKLRGVQAATATGIADLTTEKELENLKTER